MIAHMSKLRVANFALSIDGYGAGPNQSLKNPLGEGGPELFKFFFETRVFRQMQGLEGGSTGVENDFALRGMQNMGAWILGRNMFGPVRGPWPDDSWKGWWGDEPPYHVDTFVLTHHARAPLVMKGNTTFHFVTGGIHEALERARASAKGKDICVGGGVDTIRQYLKAGLVDEMHLVMAPALLGTGEELLCGIDLVKLGFKCTERVATPNATHVVLTRP